MGRPPCQLRPTGGLTWPVRLQRTRSRTGSSVRVIHSSVSDLTERLRARLENERREIEELTASELARLGENSRRVARSALRTIERDTVEAAGRMRELLLKAWLRPLVVGLSLWLGICGGSWATMRWLWTRIEARIEMAAELDIEEARQTHPPPRDRATAGSDPSPGARPRFRPEPLMVPGSGKPGRRLRIGRGGSAARFGLLFQGQPALFRPLDVASARRRLRCGDSDPAGGPALRPWHATPPPLHASAQAYGWVSCGNSGADERPCLQ